MTPAAGAIGYLVAAIAFFWLTGLLLWSRQTGRHGLLLVVASTCSLFWAAAGFWTARFEVDVPLGAGLLDMLRMVTWGLFVHSVISLGRRSPSAANDERNRDHVLFEGWRYPILALLLIAACAATQVGVASGLIATDPISLFIPALWIVTALSALIMVEELYRNTTPDRRHAIRHVCLGLGAMFAIDCFVFADTLLFQRIEPELWNVRGFLYAATVPLIALSVARNRDRALRLHVSRTAVTGSVIAAAEKVIVAGSRRTRSRMRVFLTKHLFTHKYDYRHEWHNFTDTLAADPGDAPASIVKGLTAIVNSTTGAIWERTTDGCLELRATQSLSGLERLPASSLRSLEQFISACGWIIDLDELRAHPDRYRELKLPPTIRDNATYWLIVPLPFNDEVVGMVLIGRPILKNRIIREDRDLLNTAGQQAAVLLAHWQFRNALDEAKQFERFGKLSAYIVHDVKNILEQQSLIVSDAEKHKREPAFVDAAIDTIKCSVKRMHSLLEQLRDEKRESERVPIELAELLYEAMALPHGTMPAPVIGDITEGLFVQAEREKLLRVLEHLIQNAQEATAVGGSVIVSLERKRDTALIRIRDTGYGMSKAYVRERLFRPFESTKGLTGMGIGVFESREHVRALGGDITVVSTVGVGSTFTVELPALRAVLVYDDAQDVAPLNAPTVGPANDSESPSKRDSTKSTVDE